MLARNVRKLIFVGLTIVMILAQSSCASSAQVLPTITAIVDTSTPLATSTPEDTATPEATATSTPTPLPTVTFTPNVTATQIPEITPPVEGKGNVAGLVLWNDQPVPNAAVWLCEEFSGGCTGIYQYKTNTDTNGYYVFKNVTPGKYIVAMNSFSSAWFIFYFDSGGSREQDVKAGGDLILDPWSIWKFNLHATTPRINKVLAEATPTFKWDAYPDAAYYQISIDDINFNTIVEGQRVDGIEFVPQEPLVTCRFYWNVEAFNAQGIKIASTSPGDMYFYVIDVPGKC